MKALGQDKLLRRCQDLSQEDIYGLFFMLLGAMTETEAWPVFYMVLNEVLPTWEEKIVAKELIGYGFHTKHGLFFQRDDGGNVIVRKATGGRVMFKVTLDPDTWASVMTSVSARGDSAEAFQEAREFHNKQ